MRGFSPGPQRSSFCTCSSDDGFTSGVFLWVSVKSCSRWFDEEEEFVSVPSPGLYEPVKLPSPTEKSRTRVFVQHSTVLGVNKHFINSADKDSIVPFVLRLIILNQPPLTLINEDTVNTGSQQPTWLQPQISTPRVLITAKHTCSRSQSFWNLLNCMLVRVWFWYFLADSISPECADQKIIVHLLAVKQQLYVNE